TGARTGLTLGLFAAFHIERVMHLLQRAVPALPAEIAVHRATRRQILRDVAPLTAGAQDIHHPVENFALAAAALGRGDQRLDLLPFRVREITRIAQLVTVVARAVLGRPHRAPRESMPRIES